MHTGSHTDTDTQMPTGSHTDTQTQRCTHTDTEAHTHTDTHTHTQVLYYFTALESVQCTPSKTACCKTGSRRREQPAYSDLPPLPIRVSLEAPTRREVSRCT